MAVSRDGQLRSVLQAERARAGEQVRDLTDEMEAIVALSVEAVPDDEHDAEGSTIGFERARVAALLGHAEQHLAELDSALERMESGDQGGCVVCGLAIPLERLLARPTTRTCVGCAAAAPPPGLRRPSS